MLWHKGLSCMVLITYSSFLTESLEMVMVLRSADYKSGKCQCTGHLSCLFGYMYSTS